MRCCIGDLNFFKQFLHVRDGKALPFTVLPSGISYFSHNIITFAFSIHPGTRSLLSNDVASLNVFTGISDKSFKVPWKNL